VVKKLDVDVPHDYYSAWVARLEHQDKRDSAKTTLTAEFAAFYPERLKRKEHLKVWFFVITMSLFVISLIGAFVFLVLLVRALNTDKLSPWEFLPGCITAIGGVVISLLALPKIIGKYLFDEDENKEITALLRGIFLDDLHMSQDSLLLQEAPNHGGTVSPELILSSINSGVMASDSRSIDELKVVADINSQLSQENPSSENDISDS